jgi:RHS repeat-associated protein
MGGDPIAALPSQDLATFSGFQWHDVSGDGLNDLVYFGTSSIQVWLNIGGDRLKRFELGAYPAGVTFDRCTGGSCSAATSDTVEFVDMNGNGTSDIVLVDRLTRGGRQPTAYFLDLVHPTKHSTSTSPSVGVPPNLLHIIENGLGKRTVIDYKPSTSDYVADRDAGRFWRTKAPFPVTAVGRRSVTIDNAPGVGAYVTEYHYRDAYYDGMEKEFRGFGEVEVKDIGDASQPTLVTRYRFHTGAPDNVDNDHDGIVDEFTEKGGAEAESLKGKPLEIQQEAAKRYCSLTSSTTCAAGSDCPSGEQCLGTIFKHDFYRWDIRNLYTPTTIGKVCHDDRSQHCTNDAQCGAAGACDVQEDGSVKGLLSGSLEPAPSCLSNRSLANPPVENLTSTVPGKAVHWAVSTGKRTAVIERDSGPRKDLLSEMDYDAYGNQVIDRNHGVVTCSALPNFGCILSMDADCTANVFNCTEPDTPDEPRDEKVMCHGFARNLDKWMLHFGSVTETQDRDGRVEARSKSYYDGPDFLGLPLGQVDRGDLTRRDEWLDTDGRDIARVKNKYDVYGNAIETRDARDDRRTLTYDAAFQTYPVTETVYVDGYSLVANGQPRTSGPYSLSVTAKYHEGFGVVTRSTSWGITPALGPETRYQYDTFGRLTGIVQPGDSEAAPTAFYEYHLNERGDGLSAVVTHRRETVSGGTVDSFNYVDGLSRSLGNKSEGDDGKWILDGAAAFNARGVKVDSWAPYFTSSSTHETPDPANAHEQMSYDAIGRTIESRHPPTDSEPQGAFVRTRYAPLEPHSYDENDNTITTGAFASHLNDGLSRLIRVTERNQGQSYLTRYSYDARGNLVGFVDAQGNRKTMTYDSLGRHTLIDDPDRGRMTYRYDTTDNVIETTDAKQQRIVYTYDRSNRLQTENYLDKSGDPNTDPIDVTYIYDKPVPNLDMGDRTTDTARFTIGQLASVYDLSGEEHTSYDQRRRTEWTVKAIRDPELNLLIKYPTRFGYDSMGRMTLLVYPDLDRVRYSYGSRGLVAHVQGDDNGVVALNSITYRPSGQIERLEYGNGVVTTHEYDARLRLKRLRTRGALTTTASDLIHYVYDFDPASNIVAIRDLGTGLSSGDVDTNTQLFGYDHLHRLASLTIPSVAGADGKSGQISYAYDALGNMLSQVSNIVQDDSEGSLTNLGVVAYEGGRSDRSGRKSREPPGPHAPTRAGTQSGFSATYDDNGNLQTLGTRVMAWDLKDRLTSVRNGVISATYAYDYRDQRTTKIAVSTVPGAAPVVTHYVGGTFEVRDSDRSVKLVAIGNMRVAEFSGSLDHSVEKVQRVRNRKDWNLLSNQVRIDDASHQFGLAAGGDTLDGYLWNPRLQDFTTVSDKGGLPVGSVVWLRSISSEVLVLRGAEETLTGGDSTPNATQFLGISDPDGMDPALSLVPGSFAWFFEPTLQNWLVYGTSLLGASPSVGRLAPGSGFFLAGELQSVQLSPHVPRLRFYHENHTGSTEVVTDMSGTLIARSLYYPNGMDRRTDNATGSQKVGYSFVRKERDQESGLRYFGARYYLDRLGIFTSADPLALAPMAPANPQALNAYRYALANPISATDSSGLEGEWLNHLEQSLYNSSAYRALEAGTTAVDRTLKAVENSVSVYAAHQFLENGRLGVVVATALDLVNDNVLPHDSIDLATKVTSFGADKVFKLAKGAKAAVTFSQGVIGGLSKQALHARPGEGLSVSRVVVGSAVKAALGYRKDAAKALREEASNLKVVANDARGDAGVQDFLTELSVPNAARNRDLNLSVEKGSNELAGKLEGGAAILDPGTILNERVGALWNQLKQ